MAERIASEHARNYWGNCTLCHGHDDEGTYIPTGWPCEVARVRAELKRIRAVISLAGVLANLDG